MKDKQQIEAALERSLRKRVTVSRLDRSFDAGVWARIEADESRSAAPASRAASPAPATARWLYVINVVGLVSVGIFMCVFGMKVLGEMDLSSATLPQISIEASERILADASTIIAIVAIAFGLMFTPWGRRLRDEFA